MKTLPTLLLALAATGAHAQAATLTLLPTGYTARAASADGRTVLMDCTTPYAFFESATAGLRVSERRASLWAATGVLTLGPTIDAAGISADGKVVGGHRWSDAFRYAADGTLTPLPLLPGTGNDPSPYSRTRPATVSAVSGDGKTIFGLLYADLRIRPVRWAPSGVQELAALPGATGPTLTAIVAASHDGAVAVGDAGFQAARWTLGGGSALLGNPAGTQYSHATGVSADGRAAFGTANTDGDDGGKRAPVWAGFRWTAATGSVALEGLSRVDAVSADGRLAVGAAYAYRFDWDPIDPRRPQAPRRGRWSRRPTTKVWDARGGVLDLRAMMAAQGLRLPQSAPYYDTYRELDVVGVAWAKGVLTVVSANGYLTPPYYYHGFRATLAYDPAPLRIAAALQGFRGDRAGVPVTVELRRAKTTDVVLRATVLPEADGRLVVNVPAAGAYDVSLASPRFLRRTLAGQRLAGGAASLSASLTNGDVDGNNAVDAADLARVVAALGTTAGGPGFDPLCDLDGDGRVGAVNRALVLGSQGRAGDR